MKGSLLILGLCLFGSAYGSWLGVYRKRLNWNAETPYSGQESVRERLMASLGPAQELSEQPEPKLRILVNSSPVVDPGIQAKPQIIDYGGLYGSSYVPPPGTGSSRPNSIPDYFYQTKDYVIHDGFHSRSLGLFDPEAWILNYPGIPFPPELDVPSNWYVYNPVTVQAPKPIFRPLDLQYRYYTGYYYACPGNINPFQYSWFLQNEPLNPCKWTLYQNKQDSLYGYK